MPRGVVYCRQSNRKGTNMKQLMLVISAWMTLVVGAETRTWLANVDGDWNTPGMWSDDTVPGSGDTADLSNLTGDKTITLPAAVSVENIVYSPTVGSVTNTLTLAGAALSVNNSLTVTSVPAPRMNYPDGHGDTILNKPITNIQMSEDGLISFDFMGGDKTAVNAVKESQKI